MKKHLNPARNVKAWMLAGLLAIPMLTMNAQAITYIDETWNPSDLLMDEMGNIYALWDNANNWNLSVIPNSADEATGQPYKVHFAQDSSAIVPCVIDGIVANPGALVIGDYGKSGTLILTNGGSLIAGFAAPGGEWSGVGFPSGNCLLYVGTNCTASFGSHLWVGQGTNSDGSANTGTVVVDGGTMYIPNGQLGVGWIGTGGTNYMVVTNGGKVFLRNWADATLGMPGNNSRGQLDISTGGMIIVTNNATGFFPGLVASGQLTSYGGTGTVSWNYDPASNTTTLTGVPPADSNTPIIGTQPANIVVALGSTGSFSVSVANVPCTYQWLFNNKPLTDGNGISGATTASLTIANVSTANSGIYSVLITNKNVSTAHVQSAGASLSTEAINLYPVITITGIPGDTYEVDYTLSLSTPVTWTPLTTITLGGTTQFVVDSNAPMNTNRFYKVVHK